MGSGGRDDYLGLDDLSAVDLASALIGRFPGQAGKEHSIEDSNNDDNVSRPCGRQGGRLLSGAR